MIENSLGVARYIKATEEVVYDDPFIDANGVKVTHPFLWVSYVSYDEPLEENVWAYYKAFNQVYEDCLGQKSWQGVLQEAKTERELRGSDSPINLLAGVYFVLTENEETLKKIPIDEFFTTDVKQIKDKVDCVIDDPLLRAELIRLLGVNVPDKNPGWMSNQSLELLLKHLDTSEPVLEIGCGMGAHSLEIKELTTNLVSVDRQFHPAWYTEWSNKDNGIKFAHADGRTLPFADNSIRAAIMHFVSIHASEEGLSGIVCQVTRVLKENGILAVAPQHEDFRGLERINDGQWRFFKKTKNSKGQIMLRRITLEKLGVSK